MRKHNTHNNPWVVKRSWITILMFIIGATSKLDFSLVGRVTLAEVIAFAFVPYFWLSKRESWSNQNLSKCLWILVFMFVGVALSDIINHNYLLFSARALARPVFMLGFLLFFIAALRRDPLSIIAMVYGQVIAGIIKYVRPSDFVDAGAQELGSYAATVFRVQPLVATFFTALAVYLYPRSRLAAAASFLTAGFSIVAIGGARSSAAFWVMACLAVILIWKIKSKVARRIELSNGRIFVLGIICFLGLASIYTAYIYAAPRGYLGEMQASKIQAQSDTVFGASPLGLILSGRTQVYAAVLGVLDNPIWGFGSWRHDLTSVYVVEAMASVGTDPRVMDMMARGGSPPGAGHSVLFQAWVENGVILAICYISVFIITFRVFLFNIRYENRITPFIIINVITFVWAFFFSPPGLGLRFSVGLYMAIYVVFMDRRKPLSQVAVLP